jgi:hypothetical protein
VVALVSFPKEENRLKGPDEKEFEEMVEPTLADRLRAFEVYLANEPCTYPNNELLWGELKRKPYEGGCIVISNTRMMCPACRLRLHFFHCIYNAEAYEDGPGRIPRKDEDETT